MNNNFNNSVIAARLAALNGYPLEDENCCQPAQAPVFNLNFGGASPETAAAAMKAAVYYAQHPEEAVAPTPTPAPLPTPTAPEGPSLEERIAAAVGAAMNAVLPAITAAAAAPALEQAKLAKQAQLEQAFDAAIKAPNADAIKLGNQFAAAKAALTAANSITEINAVKF